MAKKEPISEVNNTDLMEDDMMQVVVAVVLHEGLVGHNIKASRKRYP